MSAVVRVLVDGVPAGSGVHVIHGDQVIYTHGNDGVCKVTYDDRVALAAERAQCAEARATELCSVLVAVASCSSLEAAHRLARDVVGDPYADWEGL